MTFVTNPRRDASPTIAGFVFQVNVTILRWLELQDGEHLELECGEDVDTVQNGPASGIAAETRLLEQIKARSGRSLTLKNEEALAALSNFCSHRDANPTSNLKFRYITTANSGAEKGWDRSESGIDTWTALRRGRYDESTQHEAIAAIRTLLKSCALSLAELELKRFENDECRFLIMEVTGRQLFYAGKAQEAKTWLDSALSCDAYHNSVLRRNLLITMAELHASQDSRKASEFTSEAVKVSRDGKIVELLYIETLAEHGIALWRAGEKSQSYELFGDATNRILAIQSNANAWRGQFARLFAVIAYYSAVALNGKPQDGHVEPAQGLFLASNEQAYTGYRPEQLAYICIRLAMFADGIEDIWKAADWTWRAIVFAKENPTAWDAVRLSSWHAILATLLPSDFARAAHLVKVIAALEAESVIGTLKTRGDIDTNGKISELEALIGATAPEARKSILRIIPIVPVAIRLAFLRFRGATTTMTAASLTDIESVIPPNLQPENFVAEMKRALVDETDWNTLWNDGCRAFQTHEYVRGCIRCIGAVTQAPVSQSLYLQISIAQNFEKFFKTCPSLYREIVAPFFAAYWERTIAQSTGLFRTALAYTQRQVQAVDGSAEGARRLLSAMRFCLDVKFPEQAVEWLDGSK
jgi:hypothetical protein